MESHPLHIEGIFGEAMNERRLDIVIDHEVDRHFVLDPLACLRAVLRDHVD